MNKNHYKFIYNSLIDAFNKASKYGKLDSFKITVLNFLNDIFTNCNLNISQKDSRQLENLYYKLLRDLRQRCPNCYKKDIQPIIKYTSDTKKEYCDDILKANDDYVYYNNLYHVDIDVLINDVYPDLENLNITIKEEPLHGTLFEFPENIIRYRNQEEVPEDSFVYTLKYDNCESDATVHLTRCYNININIILDTEDPENTKLIATPSGGIPPYSYLWNTGDQTPVISNVELGETYTVGITDSNGCSNDESYIVPL